MIVKYSSQHYTPNLYLVYTLSYLSKNQQVMATYCYLWFDCNYSLIRVHVWKSRPYNEITFKKAAIKLQFSQCAALHTARRLTEFEIYAKRLEHHVIIAICSSYVNWFELIYIYRRRPGRIYIYIKCKLSSHMNKTQKEQVFRYLNIL